MGEKSVWGRVMTHCSPALAVAVVFSACVEVCSGNECENCDEIVKTVSSDPRMDMKVCTQCQGLPCSATGVTLSSVDPDPCRWFPCIGGKRVIHLCADDSDCKSAGICFWCGKGSGIANICACNVGE